MDFAELLGLAGAIGVASDAGPVGEGGASYADVDFAGLLGLAGAVGDASGAGPDMLELLGLAGAVGVASDAGPDGEGGAIGDAGFDFA